MIEKTVKLKESVSFSSHALRDVFIFLVSKSGNVLILEIKSTDYRTDNDAVIPAIES